MEHLQKNLSQQENELSEAKDLLAEAVKAAFEFVSTIDDFFSYGQETNFESIKKEIKKLTDSKESDHKIKSASRLEQFISKMEHTLKNVGEAYEKFVQKGDAAANACSKHAESCSIKQAEARKSRDGAVILGVVTFIGCGCLAAVCDKAKFTYNNVSISGIILAVGAGVGTLMYLTFKAYNMAKFEEDFKSMSLCFRDMAIEEELI